MYNVTPPQVEHSQRLQVFLEALGVTETSLSRLPSQLRLPVAVTCYWWQRARPPPDKMVLKVLLLGLSVGPALRPRAGMRQPCCLKGQFTTKINQSKVRVFHPSGLCWFELWSQILVDFLFIE